MWLLLLVLLCGGVFRSWSQPAQIILLRHGEKPDDPAAVHLAPRGEARARALVSLLGRNSALTSNAPVAALFASRVTKHDHSRRTGETLTPLSHELGLPVESPVESDAYKQLASLIRSNPGYRGKTVIICWTHHDLAQLAAALQVHPAPPAWKEKVYDRLWVIRYEGGHAVLHDLPQHLLKGDSKK